MATAFLEVKNRAVSTLASGIDNAVTSLSVAAGEGALFPSSFPFHITIDDEILSCTTRSTDTLTVVRARQGTGAASHSIGAALALNITAKNISDLNTAVNTLEGAPPTHAASHQDTGGDEVSVTGLSGLLADDQHVLDAEVKLIKLDDLATPDDNTDLDFGTARHGLVPKGTNTGDFLKDDGTWAAAGGAADYPVIPSRQPNRWVIPGWYFQSASSLAILTGYLLRIPIFVAATTTYVRIAIRVMTAVGGLARLGIYNWDGTLLLDAGTVDVSSTGEKAITISQQLARGGWILVIVCDVAPTLRGANASSPIKPPFEGSHTGTSDPVKDILMYSAGGSAYVGAGLPGTLPAITAAQLTSWLFVRLKG